MIRSITLLSIIAIVLVNQVGQLSHAGTQPNYQITDLPNPPSRFETKQIDGMCRMPDGRIAVCMPSGEIFFYNLETEEWQLFARGLHNPLGLLPLSNSELIVSQRPELTKVSDTDGDGVADDFEVITDQFGMSGNYHEFHFTPVRDSDGAYYFALGTASKGAGVRSIVRGKFDVRGRPGRMHAATPYRGCVMKVTADGKTIPWSYGHRTPNGLGFDLDGNLFVTDNQGDWVGTSKLFHVREGHFYGHAASLTWKPGFEGVPVETPATELAKLRSRACVIFPHGTMSNSPTKVIAIGPEANIGPFEGQLLVGEMNKPRIMRVMLEEVDGELQGACVPFIDGAPLRNGCNRFAWAADGSLIVGLTKHTWAGNEGIQRVEWDGSTPFEIQSMNLTDTGFDFTFTRPVDRAAASDPANWPFSRYYYEYRQAYGSPRSDELAVPIESITVSEHNRKVSIALKELKAWHVHEVTVQNLTTEDGSAKLSNNYIVYTLNRLLSDTPEEPLHASEAPQTQTTPPPANQQAKLDMGGTVFDAEQAQLNGPSKSASNKGFSGKGYADYRGNNQSIVWHIDSQSPTTEIAFRYALGGNAARPLLLKINDKVIQTLPIKPTPGWTTWQEETVDVNLPKGQHTIALHSQDKNGPNIDCLILRQSTSKHNTLTEAEKAAGWKLLFDGKKIQGWRSYETESFPSTGWVVEDETLHKQAESTGANIMTVDTYENFEFSWEWKLLPEGNNGVKYFITPERKATVGHEYQMIDDKRTDDTTQQTAAFYLIKAAASDKPMRPLGAWNHSRILVDGNQVEHWLNGEKVLEYQCGSKEVMNRVPETKFKKYPGFGEKVTGHILLTDHKDPCWFRNLKIREIK